MEDCFHDFDNPLLLKLTEVPLLLCDVPLSTFVSVGSALHDFDNYMVDRRVLIFTANPRLESLGVAPQFKNDYFAEMGSGSEEGSYLRLIDFCITQL